jgi:hypothetical protein
VLAFDVSSAGHDELTVGAGGFSGVIEILLGDFRGRTGTITLVTGLQRGAASQITIQGLAGSDWYAVYSADGKTLSLAEHTPEPATALLAGSALLGLAALRRWRQAKRARRTPIEG